MTFFLRKEGGSIWANGAVQNCVFLVQLLRAAGHRVFAINGGDGVAPDPALMLVGTGIEFVRLPDVVDEIDVLIEAGAQVAAEHIARVRARGGRAVAYRFGNAFIIDTERVIHGKPAGSIFNGSLFDEVWTNPQHVETCASYWETCYRAPVRVLPHIWEPLFVDAAAAEMTEGLTFGYQPRPGPKRIGIFEPNINLCKTSVLPMCVVERAFRRRPDLVGDVMVFNAEHLKGHETFNHFVAALDIQKSKKVSFEPRLKTPYALAKYCDVMVSHQWENGLNYAYYDALRGGYPLVHNSDLLPAGVGYRYHGFDAEEGGNVLAAVLAAHDADAEGYRKRAAAFLSTVRATAPANVEAHERALQRLMNKTSSSP